MAPGHVQSPSCEQQICRRFMLSGVAQYKAIMLRFTTAGQVEDLLDSDRGIDIMVNIFNYFRGQKRSSRTYTSRNGDTVNPSIAQCLVAISGRKSRISVNSRTRTMGLENPNEYAIVSSTCPDIDD